LEWPVHAGEAGVDEAGRGPLAGPVVAAAVIFPVGVRIAGLNDSKQLSEAQREELRRHILSQAVAYGLGWADSAEVDALNILEATFLSMRRALLALPLAPVQVWIDGNRMPRLADILPNNASVKTVIGGDGRIASIAAASILAKTWRDGFMNQLDERWPLYGFRQHKGYGVKAHLEAIKQWGACSQHRLSFRPFKQ
jgi:ribonuclease HII